MKSLLSEAHSVEGEEISTYTQTQYSDMKECHKKGTHEEEYRWQDSQRLGLR